MADPLIKEVRTPNVTVAVAILQQNGKFLMQLRDDIPTILYPGHWGFFGGHLEPGETAEAGVRRELLEEIGYCPTTLTFYQQQETSTVTRCIFHGELDVEFDQLVLGEGMDLELLTPDDIGRGERYSKRLQQIRPIGEPHQKILLEFMSQMPS